MTPLPQQRPLGLADARDPSNAPLSARAGWAHLFRIGAALAVLGAWTTLGYGLFGTAVDREFASELDAGGRFGVNFALYWPFYFLTLPVLAMSALALARRQARLLPPCAALTLSVVFATWMMTVRDNAYRPDLIEVALWAQLINLAALCCLSVARLVQPDPRIP